MDGLSNFILRVSLYIRFATEDCAFSQCSYSSDFIIPFSVFSNVCNINSCSRHAYLINYSQSYLPYASLLDQTVHYRVGLLDGAHIEGVLLSAPPGRNGALGAGILLHKEAELYCQG